jgi:hypothetical protein
MSYFVLFALVLVICFGINRAKSRPVSNPGFVALVILVIYLVFDLGVGIYLLAGANVDPYKQGEFIGAIFGRALIPLILALVIGSSFRKKHAIPARTTE